MSTKLMAQQVDLQRRNPLLSSQMAALTFLKTINRELAQTQLQQWTKNQAINTAITPGLERLKQDGVSIMADLPFPLSLPFEIALGDILTKAIATSAQVLQSLPKGQRLLIIPWSMPPYRRIWPKPKPCTYPLRSKQSFPRKRQP
ncbi:hypothetical protein [Megasphaera sp.]|uniref:hypothetical protein n=2 Tax=Megasphaera sp. TaxID=2023260 RepID=UPI003078374F